MTLAAELQAIGIAAAPVQQAPEVMADEHMAARHAWVTVDQPDIGPFTAPITPIGLSRTAARVRAPAPTLGQHNEQILAAHGFTVDEIARLASDGTIADRPPA